MFSPKLHAVKAQIPPTGTVHLAAAVLLLNACNYQGHAGVSLTRPIVRFGKQSETIVCFVSTLTRPSLSVGRKKKVSIVSQLFKIQENASL